MKINVFQKRSFRRPSWAQLGPTWVYFGAQHGAQRQPKSKPRRGKKREEKRSEKIDLGSKNVSGGKTSDDSYRSAGGEGETLEGFLGRLGVVLGPLFGKFRGLLGRLEGLLGSFGTILTAH